MVKQAYSNKSCNECGADLICPSCGVPSKIGTPFSNWIRNTDIDASCHDIDFVWHNYRERWFITIEEKTHGAQPSRSQKDTQAIMFQMLREASGRKCKTIRGWQEIEYRGHYFIVMENTTPENGRVFINGVERTREDVLTLLNTGRIPDAKQTETQTDEEEELQ